MAIFTTKTYDFNPTAGELVLEAFSRIGIRPTEITNSHLVRGQMAQNLILVELSNLQPNLWEIENQTIPLAQGTATYSLPAEIVMITDLYIRFGNPVTDRYINPISRTDYAALPNKAQQGFPNQYWFNRRVSPEVTFYFVPDGNGPYVAKYYYVRQTQDAQIASADTVEIVYRYLQAFTCGVAWRLAQHYAPERVQEMYQDYMRVRQEAMNQDTENVPLMIVPGIGGYYR